MVTMPDLKEQTFDFFQRLSFKHSCRRYLNADEEGKPFELRYLTDTYPKQFSKDPYFMERLFELLQDPTTRYFAHEGFRSIANVDPVAALWSADIVSALCFMIKDHNDYSFMYHEVIEGCRKAIAEKKLTPAEFCRSPFAAKLLLLIPQSAHPMLYKSVKKMADESPGEFLKEPWLHEFSFEMTLYNNASPLFNDLELEFEFIDLTDPNYRVDILRRDGFFRQHKLITNPIALNL